MDIAILIITAINLTGIVALYSKLDDLERHTRVNPNFKRQPVVKPKIPYLGDDGIDNQMLDEKGKPVKSKKIKRAIKMPTDLRKKK